MGLSTSDLPEGGSGLSKTFSPGNQKLKINSVKLEPFRFIEGAYHLMLNCETEKIEGFEGFMIDKDDSSKGNYEGQIGRVKASQYAFADGTTKSGIQVYRDKSLLLFMRNLCKALECEDWFSAQDNKHDTIEEFVAAFDEDAPYAGKWLDICVAGKEYQNKSGYMAYDMWIPKPIKGALSFSKADSGKTMKFNEVDHLKKMEIKPVDEFDTDEDLVTEAGSDFDLD